MGAEENVYTLASQVTNNFSTTYRKKKNEQWLNWRKESWATILGFLSLLLGLIHLGFLDCKNGNNHAHHEQDWIQHSIKPRETALVLLFAVAMV